MSTQFWYANDLFFHSKILLFNYMATETMFDKGKYTCEDFDEQNACLLISE